jgi:anti-sigma B factor antagonist
VAFEPSRVLKNKIGRRPQSPVQSRTVPISLDHRRIDNIDVVTCAGRMVEGAETKALQEHLDRILQFGRSLLLHVGAVEFVDSSGLGLLVRYAARLRNMSGSMKLCAPSPRMTMLLKTTRLEGVLETYASEADAISAFRNRAPAHAGGGLGADLLCVAGSSDVQAYVRGLLERNGYSVATAGNLPDALVLMQARRPRIVVISTELRQAQGTRAAEKFKRLADAVPIVELPSDFSQQEAAGAAVALLDRIRAADGGR